MPFAPLYTSSKSKMILRRRGGGDEAYVIYAIMAQITGKEKICFLLCPLRVALPYSYTFWEADNCANKNSALIGSAYP
jgi:hypothetical protein